MYNIKVKGKVPNEEGEEYLRKWSQIWGDNLYCK